jgi:hypothetical protein
VLIASLSPHCHTEIFQFIRQAAPLNAVCTRQTAPLYGSVNQCSSSSETFQSMKHRWIVGYWKADISTVCSSACNNVQQRKPDRYSFSNGWVIYHWIWCFQVFFLPPSTFGTGNGNEPGGIFFFRFGLPDYWMDGAYYAPNPKILSSKLWAWFTNVTDRPTEPTVAIRRFIHEWICVKTGQGFTQYAA